MRDQRVAVIGLGNCASALLQGIALYYSGRVTGEELGLDPAIPPTTLNRVHFACAFDVDYRKVGRPVAEAIFAPPNRVPDYGADLHFIEMEVLRGPTLDGVAPTMAGRDPSEAIIPSPAEPVDVAAALRRHRVTLVLCMLPTGAQAACEAYATAAYHAGAAFANGSATPLAALPHIRQQFHSRGLTIIGDDFKSQFGATYLNEVLIKALTQRGCRLLSSSQSNIGGNTDFLNMLDPTRGAVKERSKLNALRNRRMPSGTADVSATIAGYRPELGDNKIADLVLTASGFVGRRFKITVRLEVEDSPNAAGIITTILCGMAQATTGTPDDVGATISSLTMKSPWRNVPDATAAGLFARH